MGYLNESLPENKRLLQEGKNKIGCWMRIDIQHTRLMVIF